MNKLRSTINRVFLAVSVLAISGHAVAANITGAGATFPYPIYAKWADMYKRSTGIAVNYQSIGSGGGIKQITTKTVDFGASDKPLTPKELDKAGLMQFPAIIGGVVPVYNVKGVYKSGIKFSGEALAGIFLGKIKKWNDPALVALNPGTLLPDDTIVVVHRSDGSGTTFLFTNYLSKVSPDWRSRVGEGSAVKWPAGVGGKGNEGVASYVQKLNGAIGYVEYAYAKQNKLSVGQMRNRDGNFAMPSEEAFKAAAAGARWSEAPGMYLILTDQPGAKSWPLTGASFILMHKMQEDPATAKEVLKFFRWVFENGEKSASELDYVSMPDSVVKLIQFEWKKQIKDKSGKSLL